jgi:hypothetical protein
MDRLGAIAGEDTPVDALVERVDQLLTAQYVKWVHAQGGVILGYPLSVYGVFDARYTLPIAIFPRQMTLHGHLLGSTGAGKSTWLQFRITQHFHDKRRGVLVISPERELFEQRLMPYIPRDRWDDVLYINPKHASIASNPFHAEPGEDLDDKATETGTVLKRMMKTPLGERMEPLFDEAVIALTYCRTRRFFRSWSS